MCFLSRSFSGQQSVEALLGAAATESHVALSAIIEPQIAGQPAVLFLSGLERHGMRPLAQQGFDESLGLAVGSLCVGPGTNGHEIQNTARLSPFARAVGGAVVRENKAAGDALLAELAHGTSQESDRGGLLLVRQHLDVRQAGGVA